MRFNPLIKGVALGLAVIAFGTGRVGAEVSEVTIAQQFGIGYLPLMVMQDRKLLEKHAKAAGLGDIKVTWSRFTGGGPMNDAILSGSLHFASGGVGPLVTMWARTRGIIDVKGVAALNSMPLILTTRNPNVKSIKEFTEKDKIALPSVKVSIQAVTLQMAAEKIFGEGNHSRLDRFTVSMSHPDGTAAMLSGQGEITGHFSSPPFQYQQLAHKGIRAVLNSYEVLGGKSTFNLMWTTTKFRQENPKTYAAFVVALSEAMDFIGKNRKAAAALYIRVAKSKDAPEFILKMLNDPDIEFTMTPKNVMKYANFLYKVGSIKVKPADWKEIFFPNAHNLPGS